MGSLRAVVALAVVAGTAAMLSLGSASADAPLRSTSTSVSCEQAVVAPEQPDTCTATIADTDTGTATAPTGIVEFSMLTGGGSTGPPTCTLAQGSCQFTYPGWDVQGPQAVTATYDGDATHVGSSDTIHIDVFYSPPPPLFSRVPDLRGERLAVAKKALQRRRLRVGKIGRAFSRRVGKGHVISERPGRGKVLYWGRRVDLVVSKGKRHARR
ncbi:MAG TPA: PASTA domain-containing protein [Gaiellaceae bacterium]|nr:PASTA domain-containing protein [Gaiellaceae bacterium]